MRVIRNNPDQLVIAHSPWGYGLMLGGFAAVFSIVAINSLLAGNREGLIFVLPVGLCLLFFWVLVRPVRVIFDRPSQSVEIISAGLGNRTRVTHRLDEISRAALSTRRTAKGGSQRAINLQIKEGESAGYHPITAHTGGSNHAQITGLINAWLAAARSP